MLIDPATYDQIHQGVFVFEVRKEGAFGCAREQHDFLNAQFFEPTFLNNLFGRRYEAGSRLKCSLLLCSYHVFFSQINWLRSNIIIDHGH